MQIGIHCENMNSQNHELQQNSVWKSFLQFRWLEASWVFPAHFAYKSNQFKLHQFGPKWKNNKKKVNGFGF